MMRRARAADGRAAEGTSASRDWERGWAAGGGYISESPMTEIALRRHATCARTP